MKNRSWRIQMLAAFLIVFVVTFAILDPYFLDIVMRGPILAAVAAIFAAFGTKVASDYLSSRLVALKEREGEAQKRNHEDIAADFENLEVGELKNQLEEIKGLISRIGENELQEIAEQLRASLVEGAADDLITDLKRKIAADENSRRLRISINSTFSDTGERLSNEVEMLRARANTNMVIGCFIALFGASILALVLFISDNKFANVTDLALHMAPRLSVVVLIELFAYFFLTMYRSNLSEIRYYQNELTNIEMRKVGTQLSLLSPSSEATSKELIATDRNGVMKGDQTTLELERLKIERASMKSTIDTLTSFFRRKV